MIFLANLFTLKNLKIMLIIGAAIAAVWFYRDYIDAKAENVRLESNATQLRKYDSLLYASQTYSKQELGEYFEYQRKDLKQFLDDNKIKTSNIERIITQKLKYRDTVSRNQDLSPILEAIKNRKNIRVPVIDSTECLIIKGFVIFENDTLSLNIEHREFTNVSDVISHWERNQWKFLGIKTRLFGRRQATVIIKDKCGKSKTFVINSRT